MVWPARERDRMSAQAIPCKEVVEECAAGERRAKGAAMRIGCWARLLLMATPFLAGCGNFWQAPSGSSNTSYSLTNSGPIIVGLSAPGTSTITVTPANSFTGTVALTCAVTTAPSGATDPTCSLSPTSVTTSGTSTLTVTSTSTSPATTAGIYSVTVTGTSGSLTASTSVCVNVTSNSSATCTSAASASGDFYILNATSIDGFSIQSGKLTALSGSPTALPAGVTPWAMAIDPTGSFLYVSTNQGIVLYNVGSSGKLTLNSAGSIADDGAFAIKFDTTGHWLLDASNVSPGVPVLTAWPISTTTGLPTLAGGNAPSRALVSGGSVAKGGIAVSPDNKLVSVAVGSETETFGFTVGTDFTGATNPLSTGFDFRTAKGSAAISVAFDPSTQFLYIGETGVLPSSTTNSGALRIIPIASDVLGTEPSDSPYASGGTGPNSILAASNGYVYVANAVSTGAGNITSFLVNASAPSLTVQSNPVTTGNVPFGIAEDSSKNFLIVVNNQGSSPVDAFTFDATTAGQLDPSTLTGSAGAGPIAIVAVP